MSSFDSNEYRRVMGSFPTGVVVITAMNDEGEACAMTVGSFTSVSLDPPLVGFLPTKTSSSWGRIKACGTKFGVNILGDTQEDVCRAVAKRKTNKLEGFDWELSEHGNPQLANCIAYIDCDTAGIVDGGDHDIVLGSVLDFYTVKPNLPLLFFRGGYGSFRPGSLAVNAGISSHRLHQLDLVRTHLEGLARDLVTEVSAMCLVDGQLLTVASAGNSRKIAAPTRVGRHVPFMPPIGGVFAAFGGPEAEEQWISRIYDDEDSRAQGNFEKGLTLVRSRGYAFGVGHGPGSAIELASVNSYEASGPAERTRLASVINEASEHFNLEKFSTEEEYEFHSATAPVFDKDGAIVFSITAWGPDGASAGSDVVSTIEKLKATADTCTQELQSTAV